MKNQMFKNKNTINFKEMVRGIGAGPDCIKKIDTLLDYVSGQSMRFLNTQAINMIRNAVRLKIPEMHEIFTEYITTFIGLKVAGNTGYLVIDKSKSRSETRPTFEEWLIKSQNIEAILENRESMDVKNSTKNPKIKNTKSKNQRKCKSENKQKIFLISRRGKRLDKDTLCSNCGTVENLAWSYSESNRGKVAICFKCKPSVFERSFRSKDAMDCAILGGVFEGNRRKH